MTADILATKEELSSLMQSFDMDCSTAELLLELATGEIQGAVGQTLLAATDTFELLGTTDAWLTLPQRPVTAVSSVTVDAGDPLVAGVDFKRFGARLWRRCGWATCWTEPSTVAGTCSHGWAVEHRALQPARAAALALAREAYSNPSGLQSEAIDDYRAAWQAAMAGILADHPHLRRSLRKTYGARAGLVRMG